MIGRVLRLALAGLLLVPAALAGDSTQVLSRAKVEARLSSSWPDMLNKGWAPLRIELRNDSDRARVVSLTGSVNDWQLSSTWAQRVELGAGERAELELTLPAGGAWQSEWNFVVRCDGDSAYFSGILAAGGDSAYCNVLVTGPDEVAASEVTRWQEETSTRTVGYSAPGSTSAHDNVRLGFALHGALPRSNTAYTSLDLVVLDARKGLPTDAKLEPLMAWARSGGRLMILGEDALQLASRNGALAPWLEERFTLASEPRRVLCGLGQIVFMDTEAGFEDEYVRKLVAQHAEEDSGDAAPRTNDDSRTSDAKLDVPGLGAIPYRIFALLLLGFALLIGPANFVWVRARKRPVLLLITIPLIALVSSLGLLGYGVLVQGLDIKVASATVSLLDSRLHRSASIEKRIVFAGLSPDGLRPDPGTSVHPVPSNVSAMGPQRLQLSIERSPELLLGGDFIPARTSVMQVLLNERAARGRLEIARAPEGLKVTNSLGTRLERVVARDAAGAWYVLSQPLEQGQSAVLDAADESNLGLMLEQPFRVVRAGSTLTPALPPACFVARTSSAPFRDDCGLELNEIQGTHALFGVWGLDEEAWR
ncbi:MAG: hypothetical protein HUU28_13340 [Planctomycetaceae bacterium]|nr:hypothetical protein [Planctomycetaceae bacterium]